jgi:uncharacterized membrane protein
MAKKPLSAVNVFSIALGIFLVIEAMWGMFNPLVFGFLSTNVLHAFIHLLLGFTAIYYGLRNKARNIMMFVGILLLVVGVFYFVPVVGDLLVKLLNLNTAVAILNILLGIAAVLSAVLTPKREVTPHH